MQILCSKTILYNKSLLTVLGKRFQFGVSECSTKYSLVSMDYFARIVLYKFTSGVRWNKTVQCNVTWESCSKINFKAEALYSRNGMYMSHHVMSGFLFSNPQTPCNVGHLLPHGNTCNVSLQVSLCFHNFPVLINIITNLNTVTINVNSENCYCERCIQCKVHWPSMATLFQMSWVLYGIVY